jgi:ubiquitin-like modifier-activating enzyme ATG7
MQRDACIERFAGHPVHTSGSLQGLHCVPGELHNVNTYERFKQLITHERRSALAQAAADRVWGDICSGAAEADPALLSRFLLISYTDLKIFRYFYWRASHWL